MCLQTMWNVSENSLEVSENCLEVSVTIWKYLRTVWKCLRNIWKCLSLSGSVYVNLEMSENCLDVSDFVIYFVHGNDFLNMYRCIPNSYQEKWCFAIIIRMALHQVPSESIFTLKLFCAYELVDEKMYHMSHGTILHRFHFRRALCAGTM